MKSLNAFMCSDRQHFVLSGQAGVGKTTCIKTFIKNNDKKFDIAVTTPTNKSLKVIKESIGDANVMFKTIYSLLGLRMEPNGEVKELVDSGLVKDAGQYDLIIIDEASMLSEAVLDHLEQKTIFTGTKILFIGDNQQLPPVGETVSVIWKQFPVDFTLNKVERHDNSILTFVQSIRGNQNPVFESSGPEVFIHTDESFEQHLIKAAKQGKFHAGIAKAIAWRNMTVELLNNIIRQEYHMTKSDDPFVKYDRIVVMAPIASDMPSTPNLANTDDEGIVMNITVDRHPKYQNFKIWKLDVRMETGDDIIIRLIHETHKELLDNQLKEYAAKKMWKHFWNLKDAFHQIKHGYALTAHRSQGSSYPEIYVEVGDIMGNKNINDRMKCLYVACSRASKQLHIFY